MMNKKTKTMNPKLILISGGTASGKSLISNRMVQLLKEKNIKSTLIRMDNYYKTLDMLNEKNVDDVNWDVPTAFDWVKLLKDINNLKNGVKIKKKTYLFKSGKYTNDVEWYESNEWIILEGLFTLRNENLRSLSDLNIFVDANNQIRYDRRISRDSRERYKEIFSISEFDIKWNNVIQPMHDKYVETLKEYADATIDNSILKLGDIDKQLKRVIKMVK